MAKHHKPRSGSMAYSPRKRAKRQRPRVHSWKTSEDAKILGFAGYKAGMTHVMAVDNRKNSPTSGMEVSIPVTILEVPPMKVEGIRVYKKGYGGLESVLDVRSDTKAKDPLKVLDELKDTGEIADVRLIMSTQPKLTSVSKKKPDIMEIALGGSIDEKIEYGKQVFGKEVKVDEIIKENQSVDVVSVTKGKGFQGVVKRWGVRKARHKAGKGRRHLGTGGAWTPTYKLRMEPLPGQMGYHTRTEYNKTVMKVGGDGADVTPSGGFLNYGPVKGDYLMLHGSLPGPAKRVIRVTMPKRPFKDKTFDIITIDTTSKQ